MNMNRKKLTLLVFSILFFNGILLSQNIDNEENINLATNTCKKLFFDLGDLLLNYHENTSRMKIQLTEDYPLIFDLADTIINDPYSEIDYDSIPVKYRIQWGSGMLFNCKQAQSDTSQVRVSYENGKPQVNTSNIYFNIIEGNVIKLYGDYLIENKPCIFQEGKFIIKNNSGHGSFQEKTTCFYNGSHYIYYNDQWQKL